MNDFRLMLYIFLGFVVIAFTSYGGIGAIIDLVKKIFKKDEPVTYSKPIVFPQNTNEEPYIIWVDAGNGLLRKKVPTCPNCGGELMKKRYSNEVSPKPNKDKWEPSGYVYYEFLIIYQNHIHLLKYNQRNSCYVLNLLFCLSLPCRHP